MLQKIWSFHVVVLLTISVTGAQGAEVTGPKILLPALIIDAGEITEGEIVEVRFTFTNEGTEMLEIQDAHATSACTTVKYPSKVRPGGNGSISVRADSTGCSGQCSESILVVHNSPHAFSSDTLEIQFKVLLPDQKEPSVTGHEQTTPGNSQEQGSLQELKENEHWTETALPLRFRFVPPGKYLIGARDKEEIRISRTERPRFVKFSRGFLVAETEITQHQWLEVMGSNPSKHLSCPTCPVDSVSFLSALKFCNRLSKLSGLEECYTLDRGNKDVFPGPDCHGYRLPTYSEWEVAARGGEKDGWYGEISKIAWYEGNSHAECGKTKKWAGNIHGIRCHV